MTVEEKVLSKVRKILLADTIVNGIVQTAVYASHISSITKPIYPCISLYILPDGGAIFEANGFVIVNLQIDTWFAREMNNTSSPLIIQERLRALLHRQALTDKTIPVAGFGVEKKIGPIMVEEDGKLLHLPVIYQFTAA